jgi:hypothetical protein
VSRVCVTLLANKIGFSMSILYFLPIVLFIKIFLDILFHYNKYKKYFLDLLCRRFVNRYKMFDIYMSNRLKHQPLLFHHYLRNAVSMNIRVCAAVISRSKTCKEIIKIYAITTILDNYTIH